MIDNPQIMRTEDVRTAMIPLLVPREQMPVVIGPAIRELQIAIRSQGLKVTGPWFAHHLSLSEDIFDFEVHLPVDGSFSPDGRAVAGRWPAGSVARATLRGNYSGLPRAWEEFAGWIEAQGRQRAPDIYERYLITPHTHPESSDWLTELNWPLLD